MGHGDIVDSTAPVSPDELVYRVDSLDRIIFVNDQWDAFAHANGAPELVGSTVVGRPMCAFIADHETLYLYDLLRKQAVAGNRPLTLSFRCDSPDVRRSMTMRIEATGDGQIEFRTRPLEIDRRAPLAVLSGRTRRDPSRLLRICSWCNRGKILNGWREIDEIVTMLGLFEQEALPQLTHGVCTDCRVAVQMEFLAGPPAERTN
jgi:hypothetical protein